MPPRRKKPGEPSSNRRCKALIYGPPKHGKTHLLGTAAFDERTAPMLCLDLEGGVEDVLETMPGYGTDFVRHSVKSYDDLSEAYGRAEENDEGFRSFSIDSLSETHIFMLMGIIDKHAEKREAKGVNPNIIQEGDYGEGLVLIRRFVRMFRDLPLHGFYTAHDREVEVRREGLVTTVNLAGKAATEIPGLMSVFAYYALTENDEGELVRMLYLKNYAKIRMGVRAPWGMEDQVPDEIENPTITDILDAMFYKE